MNHDAITPLRKTKPDGQIYVRPVSIISKLQELLLLSRNELLRRCEIQDRKDQAYVPSECVLYFLRAAKAQANGEVFTRLYGALLNRIIRRLPSGESADGKISLPVSTIRENVVARFDEMIAIDCQTYAERLDFFEVRFDCALSTLRLDAREEVWRDVNRSKSIELDEDGEMSPDLLRAFSEFRKIDEVEENYRFRLNAAIKSLPTELRRVIDMMQDEIPFDSSDPKVTTISKVLGKSDKTVRTYHKKAIETLRAKLSREETP